MVNKNRLIIGLILISIISIFFYFKLDIFFISLVCLLSVYDLIKSKIIAITKLFILIFFYSIFLYITSYFNLLNLTLIFIYIASIIFSLISDKFRKYLFVLSILSNFIFFYLLLDLDRTLIYFIIFISFLNDSSAYIFGSYFKGPLIAPSISPNKTWSGTLSSIFISFSTLLIFDYSFFFSFFVAVTLFFGDLYFSFIKRKFLIKDFSNILLSHGGFLDRFDSILPVIFVFYFNYSYFI